MATPKAAIHRLTGPLMLTMEPHEYGETQRRVILRDDHRGQFVARLHDFLEQ